MARTVGTAKGRARARAALDRRMTGLRPFASLAVRPQQGWVRALREALGMSAAELGQRMGVTDDAVLKLEASERLGRIRLDTLERAAQALDCELVYALVPRRPLNEMVERQASALVGATLTTVQHTMLLEDHSVPHDVTAEQFREQVREVRDQPGLWTDVF